MAAALLAAELEALGEGYAHRARALQNVICWKDGYRMGGGGEDDTDYPTRLGREERTLALARSSPDGLEAWAGGTGAEAWMLSEVRAAEKKLKSLPLPLQDGSDIIGLMADWPDWRRAAVTVCPVAPDGTICRGLRYDAKTGLSFE